MADADYLNLSSGTSDMALNARFPFKTKAQYISDKSVMNS